jgi:hypothetical protein
MTAFTGGLMAVVAALGLVGSAQGKTIAPSVGGGDPPSICDAIAGNLVTNCGFETGDFTGWTQTPATTGSDFGVTGTAFFVNSGTFGAFFGATNPPFEDMMSQSIPTIAGDAYSVRFFLENFGMPTAPANQFTAEFGSTTLLSLTNSGPFAYIGLVDTVVATGSSTTLSFAAFINLPRAPGRGPQNLTCADVFAFCPI